MHGAQGAFFNDTYLLNTATWRWHALAAAGSPPAARHAHVCATAAGRTLIHGGSNAAQSFDGVIAAASTDFGRELSGCAAPSCRVPKCPSVPKWFQGYRIRP